MGISKLLKEYACGFPGSLWGCFSLVVLPYSAGWWGKSASRTCSRASRLSVSGSSPLCSWSPSLLCSILPVGRPVFRGINTVCDFGNLYVIRLAGTAINQITPTATLGGEVVKVLLLEPTLPRAQATAAVVIDKASVTLAQMCYLAFGLLYSTGYFPLSTELRWALGLTIGLISLGLLGFVAFQRYGLLSKLVSRLSRLKYAPARLHQVRQHVAALDAQLVAYYAGHPWRFGGSLLLHFSAFLCAASKTYVLLRLLLGDHAPGWSEAFMVAVVVAALDQMFFFVPARLGTLEGVRVLVLSTVGITPAVGLAFGLIARLDSLVWNGIGLLLYTLCTRRFVARITQQVQCSLEHHV